MLSRSVRLRHRKNQLGDTKVCRTFRSLAVCLSVWLVLASLVALGRKGAGRRRPPLAVLLPVQGRVPSVCALRQSNRLKGFAIHRVNARP